MNFLIDVLPGDNAFWQFNFANWRQIRVSGQTVTAGTVIGWGVDGDIPGTVGAFTVGSDSKSLVINVTGFTDETTYYMRAKVTFSGGDVMEFDVGFRCKVADEWGV